MKRKINYNAVLTITLSIALCACAADPNKALYRGEDISKEANIIYGNASKEFHIEIKSSGEWKLFTGTDDENIDFTTPILHGKETGVFPLPSREPRHNIFVLETSKGRAAFSQKLLPLAGGYNIRDLGGIKTSEGRFVKWGKVFRGDELGRLTLEDWGYLSAIPIVSIVDFRSEYEIEANPDKAPEFIKNQYQLSINPGNLATTSMDFLSSPDFDPEKFMENLNVQLVSDSASIEQYREFFRILQSPESAPLIFHCTAGKDRTGMGAALFLCALGVDQDTIFENYLESNTHLKPKYSRIIEENPKMEALLSVKSEYLSAGLNYIKQNYGSAEQYLTDVLNVDIKKMKKLYLY